MNIKQNKEVDQISGKRYDSHNDETKTFSLFTGLREPFIQSTPGIE